jgi:predicted PurR-regulated permease PerM
MQPKVLKIEISAKTVVFTVFFLLAVNFFWTVRDLIFSLFIGFIIMSAIKPTVSRLEKKRLPRALSTCIIFVLLLIGFGLLFFWVIPPMVVDSSLFLRSLPGLIYDLNPSLIKYYGSTSLTQLLPSLPNQLLSLFTSALSNVIFLVTTLFFSFYFTVEENFIKNALANFLSEDKTKKIVNIFDQTEKRLSSWFWGEMLLMTGVGLMSFVGLSLIGVKHALSLAVIAGLLEIVPNFGPITATVPAVLVAASQSPFLAFSTIALYFIIQQLENNLIVPMVMKRAVGLHPIVTLLALLVGGRVGGVLGVLLAIPITLFIETALIELSGAKRG